MQPKFRIKAFSLFTPLSSKASISDFENVYKEYYVRLYRYAFDFVNDIDTSKDIVSEVFSKLWKIYQNIDKDKLAKFLYVCVRNESMNYLRKQKGMDKYTQYCLAAFSEEDDSYLDNLDERLDEIYQVINTLPPKTQFVLEQCYMHQHTYKEVAAMMEITTDGVKKHITKAFSVLRHHFKSKSGSSFVKKE